MRRSVPLLIALGLALAGACTGGSDEEAAARMDARAGSFGLVEVERTAGSDGASVEEAKPHAALGAMFARYEGVERQHVLRLLGMGRPVDRMDRCTLAGSDRSTLPDPSAGVDLLDAGRLEVQVEGDEAPLSARTFPELGSFVAGVFYAEDVQLPRAEPEEDEYRIVASGSEQVPAFDVVVVAPSAPSGVMVDGTRADGSATLPRNRAASLTWNAGDPRDRIDIRLTAGGKLLECTVRDDGSFRMGRDVLSELDADEQARLMLRRVRAQRFDVPGINVARADVATKRSFTVQVQ